jgi:hypothetical protein
MSDRRENIRFISPDSFFLMSILFLGFLAFQPSFCITSNSNNNSGPEEISLSQSTATISIGIPICCFQKSWISNKDNFKLLSFEKTQFLDNNKTDQRIILIENIRKSTIKFPFSFLQNRHFPQERDELPALS